MEYISSKNIFLLLRDTLKLLDRRPMDHGSRTGYIFTCMLRCKGGYEFFELADFLMLSTLHDIGAYKTDKMGDRLNYEFKDPMPHSTYGYLFLKNITPLEAMSKMVLCHRVPCTKISQDFNYIKETEMLSLAEACEVYHLALGEGFDYTMFRRQEGTFYSKQALDLLDRAVKRYNIFAHLADDSYQKELDDLLEYMIFTNEEKKKYMETLMYCIGFRSEMALVDAVTCMCVSSSLAQKLNLSNESREKLYYASLVHDIGMLSIPAKIIEAPRKLEDPEITLMRTHVEREEKILLNRLDPEIVAIATAHHERLDGSGYPKGLKGSKMSREQNILQIADIITGITCERSYREPFSKDEVIKILKKEVADGKINRSITECYINSYDEIKALVDKEKKQALNMYGALLRTFNQVSKIPQKKTE